MTLSKARQLRTFWWVRFHDDELTHEEHLNAGSEYSKHYNLVELLKKSPTAQLCQVAQEIGNDT